MCRSLALVLLVCRHIPVGLHRRSRQSCADRPVLPASTVAAWGELAARSPFAHSPSFPSVCGVMRRLSLAALGNASGQGSKVRIGHIWP